VLVWYQLILILAGTGIGALKTNWYHSLAILKKFDTSLILVLGSNIDFGLVYGKYMLGI
jgi:hypothetical protein